MYLPPGARTRSSDRLPLAGRIAAGLPVEASETAESISLHDVVGNRDVFALEVRGDSMRDEHIISGDYVLVERTRTARQGDIVVALVHGAETTLKRYYSEGSVIRLQPANMEMEPIYVPAAQVAIQGRVLRGAAQISLGLLTNPESAALLPITFSIDGAERQPSRLS